MKQILPKLELITACLKSNPASQKGTGCAIVLHKEKRQKHSTISCVKKSALKGCKIWVLGNYFQNILTYSLLLYPGILNSNPLWFSMHLRHFIADPQSFAFSAQALWTYYVILLCISQFLIISSLTSQLPTLLFLTIPSNYFRKF